MKEDISCVFQSLAIKDGSIYIGNLKSAQNLQLLTRLNIRSIVTVLQGCRLKHQGEAIVQHLHIPADDVESFDISVYFESSYEFLEKARRHGNVLVHCFAGISRSVTIVVAYLMKKYGYSLESVLKLIKRKRNHISPNAGFLEQLRNYEKALTNIGKIVTKDNSGIVKFKVFQKEEDQNKYMNRIENILESKQKSRRGKSMSPNKSKRNAKSIQNNVLRNINKINGIKQNQVRVTEQKRLNQAADLQLPQDILDFKKLHSTQANPSKISDFENKSKFEYHNVEGEQCEVFDIRNSLKSCITYKSKEKQKDSLNLAAKVQRYKQKILKNENIKRQRKHSLFQMTSKAQMQSSNISKPIIKNCMAYQSIDLCYPMS